MKDRIMSKYKDKSVLDSAHIQKKRSTMIRTVFILATMLTISISVKGQPEAIWQLLQDGSIVRWAYSGGDEFNGTSLDLNKWYTCVDGWNREHGPGEELQYYLDDNIVLDNGILKLIAKEEPGYYNVWRFDGGAHIEQKYFKYTSGWIQTKQKFKYGLFEIRVKLPEGKGLWPAFWLFGGNPDEEFDIFEYKGETPNRIHYDMHCPNGCQNFGDWITVNGNFSDGFNVIMGEWGPNATFWYLNGREFTIWFGNLYYQASVIANLAIATNFGPFSPGPDNSTMFPSIFEIDYIRIWTRIDCEQNITIENYSQTNTDPTVITGNQITMGGNNGDANLQNGQHLKMIATDRINLRPGFEAESGSNFSAKIINCPSINNNYKSIEEQDSGLCVISECVPDSLHQMQTKSTFENSPSLYTKIYPNPTDGEIDIEFVGKIERNVKITLTNSTGMVVFIQDNIIDNKISIDISNLAKGVYILTGYFGDSTISEKIILK